MKISLNWLNDYISTDLSTDQISTILTDIGLEVEGVEEFEAVKGGLKGLVIGEVKTVEQHPNADRLKITKIDVAHAEYLNIVCGAPNVAVGQKVVVALVGAHLYPDEKGFEIKKSKIRGEASEGMLCAEDEIGLGASHAGIMVLDPAAKVGMEAAAYFKLEGDTTLEIGLTPNRVDAASHFGVARDLAVYLGLQDKVNLTKPSVDAFQLPEEKRQLKVSVKDPLACPRYSAIALRNIEVKASPDWLQNRLRAIGLKPVNNIVDITNYVLHEIGQPLHAFDADKIAGDEVLVQQQADKTKFTTLDGVERNLSSEDLMICNADEAMCIAGVFGGEKSGVTAQTKNIFLESAYFAPTGIRKTAKRFGLNTDASFRYERGADPEITIYALKRAAMLMQEIAGAEVDSDIFDFYPEAIEPAIIDFKYENCDRLLGEAIDRKLIQEILKGLEIKILNESKEGLRLSVPTYRVDVQREVDLIEEILRIYGYNRIKLPEQMRINLNVNPKPDAHQVENTIGNYLASNSFNEIFTNSLTNPSYYQEQQDLVKMLNPLSTELEVLRKSMLFGGLESMAYNLNRQRKNLKFFEFGKVYKALGNSSFEELKAMGIWMTGKSHGESWRAKAEEISFFDLKEMVENCLSRLGISKWKLADTEALNFDQAVLLKKGKRELVTLGKLNAEICSKFDIKQEIYYAEFNWTNVLQLISPADVQYKPVIKYPAVRRDLALLVDEAVSFDAIREIAKNGLKQSLKQVNLFDVYQGKNLAEGKKSYALSFTLQDENKTLSDKQIDGMMSRLIDSLKRELGAELR